MSLTKLEEFRRQGDVTRRWKTYRRSLPCYSSNGIILRDESQRCANLKNGVKISTNNQLCSEHDTKSFIIHQYSSSGGEVHPDKVTKKCDHLHKSKYYDVMGSTSVLLGLVYVATGIRREKVCEKAFTLAIICDCADSDGHHDS